MKTRPILSAPSSGSLLDALLVIVAGAMFGAQTRGEVKPFGLQRLTLKAMSLRHGR